MAQRSEIRQRECEAILVLIPNRAQSEAAEFQTYSTTIPVIRGLHRGILQKSQLRIETNVSRRTETLFTGVPVAEQKPELVKKLRPENDIRIGGGVEHASATSAFTWDLQVGIAAAHCKWADAVVGKNRTRIDAGTHKVVIYIPFDIGSRAGLNAQARDEGRKMTGCGQERSAGQIHGAGKNVAPSGYHCASESRIDEVFLREFPSHDLPHRRSAVAGRFRRCALPAPWDMAGNRRSADKQGRHSGLSAIFRSSRDALRIKTIHQAIFDFICIGENVAFVKVQNVSKIVDSGLITVNHARLNNVFPPARHELPSKNSA